MSVNGITNAAQTYDSKGSAKTKSSQSKHSDETKQNSAESTAAIYEKSDETTGASKKVYRTDTATVEKLKAEADRRTRSLRDLVEKMMTKQGQTFNDATDIYEILREGKLNVDPETRAQAQKDISEDGYWGINQTSERLVSFAKALTGGDTSKADEMIAAVKKGYEQATGAWGDELPEICKKTLDAAVSKLEAWRDGKENTGDSMTDASADNLTGQAAASKMAK